MSAIEVIEQIERLPEVEQKKVFSHLLEKHGALAEAEARSVSPEFERVADKVFTRNAKLFRKLAQ